MIDAGGDGGLSPRVGVREIGRVNDVEGPARVVLGQRYVADLSPVLAFGCLKDGSVERVQPTLLFEGELQLGQHLVDRVAEAPEQRAVDGQNQAFAFPQHVPAAGQVQEHGDGRSERVGGG